MFSIIPKVWNTCLIKKKLNMGQWRWMEYLKDYDFELSYHPRKANFVMDPLSRKEVEMLELMIKELKLIKKLRDMNLGVQLEQGNI